MKKLLLALLFLLFVPVSADAAVPALQSTQPYKRLLSYVERLENIENATNEQKAKYRSGLTARVQSAESQVVVLFDRRKNRLEKNYQALWRKQSGEVKRRSQSRLRSADRDGRQRVQVLRRGFLAQKSAIKRRYSGRLNQLQRRITSLRNRAGRAQDPREEALLLDEINLVQREVQSIEGKRSREIGRARRSYTSDIAAAQKILRRQKATILRQEKVELQEARRAWKSENNIALQSLRTRRGRENSLVRNLQNRGIASISAMRS